MIGECLILGYGGVTSVVVCSLVLVFSVQLALRM